MDKLTLLLLVVVAIIIVWAMYPQLFNWVSGEGFKSETKNVPMYNTKEHQRDLNNEVDRSSIIGLPSQMIPAWEMGTLNDGADGNMGMGFNMCSNSCCSTQYPPPFDLPVDPLVCGSKDEFVPSSYTCNNGWQDSGCLCMTKEQALFLNKRGNNA